MLKCGFKVLLIPQSSIVKLEKYLIHIREITFTITKYCLGVHYYAYYETLSDAIVRFKQCMFEFTILLIYMSLSVDLIPVEEKVHEVIYTNEIFSMVSPEAEKVSLGKVSSSRCVNVLTEIRESLRWVSVLSQILN